MQALNGSSNASVEIDRSLGESDVQKEAGSKKRCRTEPCVPSSSKACREKQRRDRLNDKFMELGALLEPGRPPKTDKAAILVDAVRMVTQLRGEAQKLKDSNLNLQEKIKELKAEKNELRDEKQRLKAEKEKLEQQLKTMNAPQPGFLPPAIPAAFAAQNQGAGNKLVPIISYPGVAMWQFMPPAAVDTSQDHVLRPPGTQFCSFADTSLHLLNCQNGFQTPPIPQQNNSRLLISHVAQKPQPKSESRISHFLPICTLSSPKPPTTKEEAILQAKTSLSSTLEKPLNNPKLAGKIKKIKQPRFRVEIPVIDDSPSSLSQLAVEVFGDMPIRRKGSQVKILILWASQSLTQAANKAFDSHSSDFVVRNVDVSSVLDEDVRTVNSADVAVFLAPEASQLGVVKTVTDSFIQRPVRGILSKRKGVIFKCVKDGILSAERWNVLVEEEGELRVVTTFKARPSIAEVENVLYNLMAMNSPVTKSAKFLKDLVSNVTGKQ
ncbi:Transcription factor ILR3 [Sesamum alatum]|uniref:Transcription factor ILR3 n=1 Tax=Sesamum alatum TaxID=300844 RepID=A0AAE2CFZ3_9LAMI|nr:Transcription factor ILR3 [Sesamum alatum]